MLMMWWSRCRSLNWGRVFLRLRSITVRNMIRRSKNIIIAKMILLMCRGGNTDGESHGNTCTSLLNRKCKFYTLGCKSRAAGRNSLPSNANTHVRAGTLHRAARDKFLRQCPAGRASADSFLILHILEKNSRTRILYDFSTKKSQFSMLKPKTVICGFLRGVRKVWCGVSLKPESFCTTA